MPLQRRNREFKRFAYKACTGTCSMLKVRVVVLEYSQLHKEA